MMFRNIATACLLALAHDAVVVMAQIPLFSIPSAANVRGKYQLNQISNTIQHAPLDTSRYSIQIQYYKPGCQGTPLTPEQGSPTLDSAVDTTAASSTLYSSTITNSLESLRNFVTSTATKPFFQENVGANAGSPTHRYVYCVEFLLKDTIEDKIVDQERYDVILGASLDGTVSTGATVTTDTDTNPEAATFTAKVIVCDPATGVLVTKNCFQGDEVGLCFTSNNFPAASITGFANTNGLTWNLQGATTAGINISPGTSGTGGTYVPNFNCAGGVETCRITVPLVTDSFFPPGNPTSRIVEIKGTLTMRFGVGTRRRNVRVLFQDGDLFPRNVGTSLIVLSEEAKTNNTCECNGLFFIICWFFKCFLGLFK